MFAHLIGAIALALRLSKDCRNRCVAIKGRIEEPGEMEADF